MEFAVYILLFIILFLGVLVNLKITNTKKVNEIKNKLKKIKIERKEFNTTRNDL